MEHPSICPVDQLSLDELLSEARSILAIQRKELDESWTPGDQDRAEQISKQIKRVASASITQETGRRGFVTGDIPNASRELLDVAHQMDRHIAIKPVYETTPTFIGKYTFEPRPTNPHGRGSLISISAAYSVSRVQQPQRVARIFSRTDVLQLHLHLPTLVDYLTQEVARKTRVIERTNTLNNRRAAIDRKHANKLFGLIEKSDPELDTKANLTGRIVVHQDAVKLPDGYSFIGREIIEAPSTENLFTYDLEKGIESVGHRVLKLLPEVFSLFSE